MSDDLRDGLSRLKTPDPASLQLDDIPGGQIQIDQGPEAVPKPKQNACIVCRKRKLRCDGGQPSCATCTRLNHECTYIESRRKSGPRRGYVRTLETRLGSFWLSSDSQSNVNTVCPYITNIDCNYSPGGSALEEA